MRFTVVLLVAFSAWTSSAAAMAAADDLQAGVAVVDITPPVPYRMCGYFNERLSTGVLDPLHAKAIVLRQDGRELASRAYSSLAFCSYPEDPIGREEAIHLAVEYAGDSTTAELARALGVQSLYLNRHAHFATSAATVARSSAAISRE